MASRQFEQARRFFSKATQLDKHNAHAWIGFGHAFAEQVMRWLGLLLPPHAAAETAVYFELCDCNALGSILRSRLL
jgi:hypothetical protein